MKRMFADSVFREKDISIQLFGSELHCLLFQDFSWEWSIFFSSSSSHLMCALHNLLSVWLPLHLYYFIYSLFANFVSFMQNRKP